MNKQWHKSLFRQKNVLNQDFSGLKDEQDFF